MINALKTLFSIESGAEPEAETVSPKPQSKAKPQTTLEVVTEKIAAFKAEIESRAEEDRQLTTMLAEEAAKQERLRQAGADLKKVHEDLTRARQQSEQKTVDVRAAAALTRQADRELFKLLQELESPPVPSAPPTSPTRSAPPVPSAPPRRSAPPTPPAPPRRPEPAPAVAPAVAPAGATAVVTPVSPEIAPTIGSPEAAPYLNISPYSD